MEFDFSSDRADRPRRGPPPRFASRMAKQSENQPSSKNEVKHTESGMKQQLNKDLSDIPKRRISSIPCRDSMIAYTKENAVDTLTNIIPDFGATLETINTAAKWQDKVSAFQTFLQYVKDNKAVASEYSEAIATYCLIFTNNCTASNVNILRAGLECLIYIISTVGLGTRCCFTLIPCLLNKIQEKSVSKDINEILSLMCEKVGPDKIIDKVVSEMEGNKKPMQQKAVLQWILTVIEDFGVPNLNSKAIISYLQKPTALKSSSPDVKKASVAILFEMVHQMGNPVISAVDRFDLPELQLKKIREDLSEVTFDPSLASRYKSTAATASTPTLSSNAMPLAAINTPSPTPVSLFDPSDITAELPPLLRDLRNTSDKESWKVRQEAILSLTALLTKKESIVNAPAIAELVSVLKSRLSESNLNLRTKVVQCIGRLASSLGVEVQRYTSVLIPDLLRLSSDSKSSVVDAVFSTLTAWLVHNNQPQASIFNGLIPHLPIAFKSPRGRQEMLVWLRSYITLGEPRQLIPLISPVLDSLLDKSKDTRTNALSVLEHLIQLCGAETVRANIGQRNTTDDAQLRSFIDTFEIHSPKDEMPSSTGKMEAKKPDNSFANDSQAAQDAGEKTARLESMARRPGVRLLTKPKLGADGKPIPKYNPVSSIPKPMPRRTVESIKRTEAPVLIENEEIPADDLLNEIPPIEPYNPIPAENPIVDESGISLNSSEGASESPKPYILPPSENVNNLRLSFGIPIKHDDLLLHEYDELVNVKTGVLSSFSLQSSQFVNNFISSLRHISTFFHDCTAELAVTYRGQVDSLQGEIDLLSGRFCPNSGIQITTDVDVSNEDLEALSVKVNYWVILITKIIRNISKLNMSEYYASFVQSLCNLLLAILSPNTVISEIPAGLSVDCIVCILSMCCEGIFSDSAKQTDISNNRVLSYQRILVLVVKRCSPLNVLQALVLYASSELNHLKIPQFAMLLENMVKSVKTRISRESRPIRFIERDYNRVKRLYGKFPNSLQAQINLCLCLVAPKQTLNKKAASSVQSEDVNVSVSIPDSIREILDHRIKEKKVDTNEHKDEADTTDLDERMERIRQRIQRMKKLP